MAYSCSFMDIVGSTVERFCSICFTCLTSIRFLSSFSLMETSSFNSLAMVFFCCPLAPEHLDAPHHLMEASSLRCLSIVFFSAMFKGTLLLLHLSDFICRCRRLFNRNTSGL
ncbi:unnamed protein product [Symbiodinium necroappetens]|uniref:Uncharacterized protein n=1 Tax=Symbiodinium necroappetens TaxID=1628268 RepID=A0A812TJ55_9DINO|nr:unnamed protein product [Symbiodinium necroappetens]